MLPSSLSHRVIPDTPVGPLTLVASPAGICALHFGVVRVGGSGMGGRAAEHGVLDAAALLLEGYFRGKAFDVRDLALDLSGRSAFSRAVLTALSGIPWGRQTTYGSLAAELGRPRGARAVGQAVGGNPIPILIPCHRVLPTSGQIGGFSGGVERKRILLHLEGWTEKQGR
jgi:methylated-DNA-[protein]-cysteine S-methyltransferase